MICVGGLCDKCNHKRKKIDGWLPSCDAFPEGIPKDFAPKRSVKCFGEIGYDENEELAMLFEPVYIEKDGKMVKNPVLEAYRKRKKAEQEKTDH